MWGWFSTNGTWVLIVSAIVLALSLFSRGQVHKIFENLAGKKPHKAVHRGVTIGLWTIGGLALLAMALSITAILSTEGAPIVSKEAVQQWLLDHGSRILAILAFGIALWFFLKVFLPPLIGRTLVKTKGESKEGVKKRRDTLLAVFMSTGKVIIVIIIVFMLLSELDIPIAPALAGFGIAGVAVGFGAQYLIRDLIAGVFILLENQYRVGDVARVADISGVVEEINLRKTVLRDLDGIVHHVPNGEIKVASNFSRHFARVNLNVSVSYGTDLDHAIAVINRVCQEMSEEKDWRDIIIGTLSVLRVDNLGDSGIDIKIVGDVKPLQQWAVMGELRKRIKKTFDEVGIEIPWPHIKLYFGQVQNEYQMCKVCSHPNPPGSKFCSNCGASLNLASDTKSR